MEGTWKWRGRGDGGHLPGGQCVRAYLCVCAHACVSACVCARACVCVRAYVCVCVDSPGGRCGIAWPPSAATVLSTLH
jgi:hypothetical protein